MPAHPIVAAARPPFLVLAPICVFLGVCTVLARSGSLNYASLTLILLGALSAHMSVNLLNEYFDFDSGLDFKTDRTPFSGGSGALTAQPDMAKPVLYAGLATLGLTVFIGLLLTLNIGPSLLPYGVIGMALVITYTQWINRVPLICLIAPGLGFGVLMVLGTHQVLMGTPDRLTVLLALVPFFLINNLLLLNQYPDLDADRSTGRRTFPIVYGITTSNLIYLFFCLVAYGLVATMVILQSIPVWCLLAVIPAVFSAIAYFGAYQHREHLGLHPGYLACNVIASLITPLLLGLGLLLG